jgi:PAS domain S-box-containing protein
MKKTDRILMIDDSAEDRAIVRRLLMAEEASAYLFLEEELGATGLETYFQQQPDCVLLDYNLPDIDGLQVLRQLNPDALNPRVPVILLTGWGDEALAVETMKSGAQDYLVKGKFSSAQLRQSIHCAIELVTLRRERQAAETELRESEAHLTAIVNQTISGIAEADSTGRFTFVNDRYCEIIGYTRAELLGKIRMQDITYPDDLPKTLEDFQRLVEDGVPFTSEKRYVHKDGSVIWVSNSVSALTNADGQRLSVVAVMVDISERKKQEEQLRIYENVVLNTRDAVLITEAEPVDLPGPRIVAVNQAFCEMTGYTQEEVIGQTPRILQGAKTDRGQLDKIRRALKNWEPVRVELTNYRKDGSEFEVEFEITPVADNSGWFTHWVSVQRDVTTRKRAEERIRVNEERLNLLHEITSNPTLKDAARFEKLLRLGCEQFGLENGVVGEVRGERFRVTLAVSTGNSIPVGFTCSIKDSFCDEVLQRNNLLAIENASGSEWRAHQAHSGFGTETYFGVPLQVDGRVFGTLCFTSLKPRQTTFTRADEEFLLLLANTIGAEMTRQHFTEQLRVSEERLTLATKGANIGTFDWNIKTGEIQWSDEIIEAVGYTPEKFNQSFEGFSKLIHPLDHERVERCLKAAMKDGDYECEFRMLKSDGSIRWVIGKGRVFFDDEGNPARLVGVDIDITKRKQMEEDLLASQQFTSSIIETAPTVLYTFDLTSHRPTYLTDQAATVLGYTFEEVKSRQADFLRGYMHPDDAKAAEQHFQRITLAENGEVFEFEYRMRHKSGEWRWFRSRDRVFKRDEKGKAKEILGIALDITERKLAMEQLREEKQVTQSIIETTPSLIYIYDLVESRNSFISNQAMEVLGYTADEIAAMGTDLLSILLHPDDVPAVTERFEKILADRADETFEIEYRMRHKDGQDIWLFDRARIFRRDREGVPLQILGVANDITTRKTSEVKLLEQQELIARQYNEIAAVYQTAPVGLAYIDRDLRVIRINERLAEINGVPLEETVGRTLHEILPASLMNKLEPLLRRILETGEPLLNLEVMGETEAQPGIERVWVINYYALKNREGAIIGVNAVVQEITERKRAEEKIKALSDYNRNVLESITDPFFTLDRDYRFTYMTSQAEKLFFRAPGEIIGKSLWDEFPGVFGTPFEKMYRGAMEENVTTTVSGFYPDHDRWYEATAFPSPNGATVYFKDISERQRTELNLAFLADLQQDVALLASERAIVELASARITNYLKLSHCVFVEMDDAQKTARVIHDERAAGAADLMGVYDLDNFHTAEECASLAAGKTIFINNVRDGKHSAEAADSFESLGIRSLITASYISEGKWKFALSAQSAELREWRLDERELLSEIASRIFLRLERARTEQALRESEERFRSLFNSIEEGFCLIEMIFDENDQPLDYRFLQINPAFERHAGLTGAVGKTIREILPGLEDFWFETYGQVALTGESARFEHEVTALGRWYDVYASRVGDPAGRCVAVVFNNITERKESEKERERLLAEEQAARAAAEAATRAKDEFVALVSHELRNPLNAILGYNRMLQQGTVDDATRLKYAGIIDRNARRQLKLLEDLLDTARIVSGKLKLSIQSLNFIRVIHDAMDAARPSAEAKQIALTMDVDNRLSDDTEITGDPDRLQQVIWNLLTNAIKFTPARGAVMLRLEPLPNSLRLVIRDTGQGIAPEMLPHIFNRFRQADASSTRRQGGLGLGLALVKELVEMHGGTITATSAGKEQGATFTLDLPRRAPVSAPEGPGLLPSPLPNSNVLSGLRLLVVDDEVASRETLTACLTANGAQVTAVANATAALAVLINTAANTPDVLLCDIGMPDIDGYELIRQVRQQGLTLPAVAVTAFGRSEDRMRALLAGFQMHVPKPVEPAELIAVIDSLINRKPQKR